MGIKILTIIDWINEWVGRATTYLILAVMGATVIEVVCRYVFNRPTIWAYEFEQLSLAVVYILVGGYVLYHRGHVAVDVLYIKLSPRTKTVIDMALSFPLMLIMAGVLAYTGTLYARDSMKLWEHTYSSWSPPIWPVKLMIPIGSSLLVLQLIADFTRRLITLRSGSR